jgi:hypothetical protein
LAKFLCHRVNQRLNSRDAPNETQQKHQVLYAVLIADYSNRLN